VGAANLSHLLNFQSMKYLYFFVIVSITIFSCDKNKNESQLRFIHSDTLYLNSFNREAYNLKYKLSNNREFLIILQNRKFSLWDLNLDKINKSVDLVETDLVLPEDLLGAVGYDEKTQTFALLYPYRKKVIFLSYDLSIEKEINLIGLAKASDVIFNYGDYFYFSMEDQLIFLGTKLPKLKTPTKDYFQQSKFISTFNFDGEMIAQFGGFPDSRKELIIEALSQGTHSSDIDLQRKEFYVKAASGSSEFIIYNFDGSVKRKGGIESELINYNLSPYKGEGLESGKINDSFIEFKWINENLIVTRADQFSDESLGRLRDQSTILIEDMANQKLYSKVIDPFQYLVFADEKELRFIRTHPNRDELIMVRVEYALE
jgi:hypothetical protein